jgi:hypothetical protein
MPTRHASFAPVLRLIWSHLAALTRPAPQLLPPAAKLAAVRAAAAQFGGVREKILDAAALTAAEAEPAEAPGAGALALCAPGAAEQEEEAEEEAEATDEGTAAAAADAEQRTASLAPAGATDFDREGSTSFEPARRLRVRHAQALARARMHACARGLIDHSRVDATAGADAHAGALRTPLCRAAQPQRKAAAGNPSYNERAAAARAALEDEDTPLGSAVTKQLRDWLFDHFLHPVRERAGACGGMYGSVGTDKARCTFALCRVACSIRATARRMRWPRPRG